MVTQFTLAPVEQLVIGSWGEIKSAKSTLGLSFPTPWVMFDFDQGFARAKPRLPLIQPGKTLVEVPPGTVLTPAILSSADMIVKSYRLPIKFPKAPVRGWLGLWEDEVLPDMVLVIEDKRFLSMLFDTGTVLWNLAKDAMLERAQKSTRDRTSLLPVEYTMPNGELRAVLGSGKHYNKNMYISHHVGGKYEDRPSGSVRVGDTWDGWNHLGAVVDVIVKTSIEIGPLSLGINGQGMVAAKIPVCHIETNGYSLESEGCKIELPTFQKILDLTNEFRARVTV